MPRFSRPSGEPDEDNVPEREEPRHTYPSPMLEPHVFLLVNDRALAISKFSTSHDPH
jgi:hypothetical protein